MIRLTTLVENTALGGRLRAEHGFSVFVETESGSLLFDTGQTDAFIHNAKILNRDLSRVEKVVLSHGHYDHAGGLSYLSKLTKPVVYAHPEIFRERYVQSEDRLQYIGMEKQAFYEENGITFEFLEHSKEIVKGAYTTGVEAMVTDFEEVTKTFVYKSNGEYRQDDIIDDLSLVLHAKRGLFIVFGCAHRGIINIIRQAEEEFGRNVYGFVGGTHLGPAGDIQKRRTFEELKKKNLSIIGPSHCTGLLTTAQLYCEFKDKVLFNNAGSVIELD